MTIYDNNRQGLKHWFPDIEVVPWMFEDKRVQPDFWEDKENHLKFFNWLGIQLGYKHLDDWYNLTTKDIQRHGGIGLLHYYNSSPSKALQGVYPEHNWKLDNFKKKPTSLWRKRDVQRKTFFDHIEMNFTHTPVGFWSVRENHIKFFNWLFIQLQLGKLDDWYNIVKEDIYKYGGGGILDHYYNGSLSKALQFVYPEHRKEIK